MKKLISTAFAAASITLSAHAALGESVAARKDWLATSKATEVYASEIKQIANTLPLEAGKSRPDFEALIPVSLVQLSREKNAPVYFILEQEFHTKSGAVLPFAAGKIYQYFPSTNFVQTSSYLKDSIHEESYALRNGSWYQFEELQNKILTLNAGTGKWEKNGSGWKVFKENDALRTAYCENSQRTLFIYGTEIRKPLEEEKNAMTEKLDAEYQQKAMSGVR